jgi:hypothetical protein
MYEAIQGVQLATRTFVPSNLSIGLLLSLVLSILAILAFMAILAI